MNLEEMKQHAIELLGIYQMLLEDTGQYVHDVNAHNLCSAVVERNATYVQTLYAYSNPSGLSQRVRNMGYNFVIGDVPERVIDRGGMQDLHTEVRLINHLFDSNELEPNTVVSFFSSRSVCTTCRKAILTTMKSLRGTIGLNAYEFKVEQYGIIREYVYPILNDPNKRQEKISFL